MQPPEADVTWVKDNNMEVSWLYGKIILGREGALCSDLPGYLPRFACEKISRSKHRRWLVDGCVNMCVFDEWRWPMPGCDINALRSVSCTTKTSTQGIADAEAHPEKFGGRQIRSDNIYTHI